MLATAHEMNSMAIQEIKLCHGDALAIRSVFQPLPELPKGCIVVGSKFSCPELSNHPQSKHVGGTFIGNTRFMRVDDRHAFKYGPSTFEVHVTDIFSTTMTNITNPDLAKNLIGSRVRAIRPRVHRESSCPHGVVIIAGDLFFKIREKGFEGKEAVKAFSYTNDTTKDRIRECEMYVSELHRDGHLEPLKSTIKVAYFKSVEGQLIEKICMNIQDVSKLMQVIYPTLFNAETAMTLNSTSISVDHFSQATHGQIPFLTLDLNARPLEDTSTPQKFGQLFKIHMRDIPSASTIGIEDRDDRKIRFMHMPKGPLYCMTDIATFVYNSNGKRSLDNAWNAIDGKDEDDGSPQHGFLKFHHGRVQFSDVYKMCIGLNPQGTGVSLLSVGKHVTHIYSHSHPLVSNGILLCCNDPAQVRVDHFSGDGQYHFQPGR